MNFFKSVFADDDHDHDQQQPLSPQPASPSPEPESEPEDQPTAQPTWGFVGGLIKTFATKSESIIQTYRHDLDEFTTGLKKETQVLKDVATSSLEVGASKAQVSLESVGQAFDSFGSVVAHIITHGGDDDGGPDVGPDEGSVNSNLEVGGKYSRFEVLLRGIQTDTGTFIEDPEDVAEFERWKLGFHLGEKGEEIEGLMRENGKLRGIYERVVPNVVDHEVFWLRYFFRVWKLEQAESVRARLVERANEDEDLSWDVEDDDEEEVEGKAKGESEGKIGNVVEEKEDKGESEGRIGNVVEEKEGKGEGDGEGKIGNVVEEEEKKVVNDESVAPSSVENVEEVKKDDHDDDGAEEKVGSEVSKDSDMTVVSSQPSFREEEDLGWDEIEDLGSDDEDGKNVKGKQSESTSSPSHREELRKRLSVAEDDEDLSWDIEDDDEPIKKS